MSLKLDQQHDPDLAHYIRQIDQHGVIEMGDGLGVLEDHTDYTIPQEAYEEVLRWHGRPLPTTAKAPSPDLGEIQALLAEIMQTLEGRNG